VDAARRLVDEFSNGCARETVRNSETRHEARPFALFISFLKRVKELANYYSSSRNNFMQRTCSCLIMRPARGAPRGK